MKLLIVIPALDEEASIGSTIERCLEARASIKAETEVTEVEITVVSDGSTDGTVEIARDYTDRIELIVFETNRGYGAAIQEAWHRSDADLLSFLDADGTCDPAFFAPLCNALLAQDADVALGCRLNPDSRMPALRRVGNTMFAWMLSVFSDARVGDAASGMRVVPRTSLPKLYPLPTGLHFTPAMSARALLNRRAKIVEIDMPYHEREGESKLSPLRDGIRFLRVILETAFLYRPSRPLGLVATLLLVITVAMMIRPTWYYLHHRELLKWMQYRFLVGELLSTVAMLILCASYLGRKAADIALSDDPSADKYHGLAGRLFRSRVFWVVPAAIALVGVGMVARALVGFLRTGEVFEHWSRFVAMMFFLSTAAILVVTRIIDYTLNLLADQLSYLKSADAPTGGGGSS